MKKGVLGFLVLVIGLVFAVNAIADDSANYKIKIGDKEVGKAKIKISTQGEQETAELEISYKVGNDSYSIKQTAVYKNKRILEFTSEYKENEKVKTVVGQLKGDDYVIFVGGERNEIPSSQIEAFSLDMYVGYRPENPEKPGKTTILDLVPGKIGVRDIKREGDKDIWIYPEGWKRDLAIYNPPARLPTVIKLKRGSEKDNYFLEFERIWK